MPALRHTVARLERQDREMGARANDAELIATVLGHLASRCGAESIVRKTQPTRTRLRR